MSCFTNHTYGRGGHTHNLKVRLLSSATTLGAQLILFERVRRLGYCHPLVISFLSFLRFFENSTLSGLLTFRNYPPASNLAAILI